jgi:hypothetical protein
LYNSTYSEYLPDCFIEVETFEEEDEKVLVQNVAIKDGHLDEFPETEENIY